MEFPNRKRNRLEQYDYSSPGAYFVTICTHNKEKIFGEIVDGDCFTASQIKLSEIGFIANEELLNIEKHYENVKIDKYVIMPNHIHILLVIAERMNPFPTTIKFDLSNIIGKYKASVTRSVGKAFMPSEKNKLWQSSFHDHIIRGNQDYRKIWEYIHNNPAKWKEDCFYSE